jgi:hypothetical protein
MIDQGLAAEHWLAAMNDLDLVPFETGGVCNFSHYSTR